MNKTQIKTFFAFVLFLVFSSTVFAKKQTTPAWVADINSVYNERDYVARLGVGATQNVAKIEALTSISEYFKTKIHTDGVMTRTVTSGGQSGYSVSAVQKIAVQSNAELFCVEYEYYYDKKSKKYYCAAFINKEKYWKQAQPKIENKRHEFERYYGEAENLLTSEPILAKKYYMLAQQPGAEFLDLVQTVRLIVEEKAGAYSKDEKRVYEVEKKINDAENAIAIFVEIQGDWSNTVASKVKTLFENEGYSFTSNKKNSSHIMKITIEQNLLTNGKGTEYETVSVAPSMALTLTNPYMQQNLFSFSRKAAKGVAFNQDVALRKGFDGLCKELDDALIENFRQKMLEE